MRKTTIAITVAAISVTAGSIYALTPAPELLGIDPITTTEHGFKTSRGTEATRLRNETMGQFLQFDLTNSADINNADRAEVYDYFKSVGCGIFQGGGYPSAPIYVTCSGVTDKPTATVKLKAILPGLDKVMADMALGIPVHIKLPKPKYEWPVVDCKFKDISSSNGYEQYKVIEETPGHCKEVIDKEAMRTMYEIEAERVRLWQALQTRILSPAELKRVCDYGNTINLQNNVPYREEEKQQERATAWKAQATFREIAHLPPAGCGS